MKILFVLEYFYPHVGGAETVFDQVTSSLVKRGHKVVVLTTRIANTEPREKRDGVEILRVNTPPFARRYWFTFLGIVPLLKLAKKFDLLHTTTFNAALPAWIAAKISKKKIVLHILEVFGKEWFALGEKNFILAGGFYLYEKLLFWLPFDYYIAISLHTKKQVEKIFGILPQKITVIYPQIDKKLWNPKRFRRGLFRKCLGTTNKEFVYLFFGRPGISKGVEYLIRAIPKVVKKIKKAKFVLILSRDPQDKFEKVERMIESLKIQEKTLLLKPSPQEELPGYVLAADCVVIPSLSEGFGLSAYEAAIMGVPLVVSEVGALKETVFGKHIFVKPKDVSSLTKGMIEAANGRYSRREKLAQDKKIVSRYQSLYKMLARSPQEIRREWEELRLKIQTIVSEETLPSGMEGLFHINSELVWRRFMGYLEFLGDVLPVGAKVLDAGCGLGQITAGLKILRPDTEVFGVDLSKQKTWEELSNSAVKFEKGSVLSLRFKQNTFDAVVSFGVMEHLNDERPMGNSKKDLKFLREMFRVIKLGGILYIFHLPNKFSFSEAFAEILGLWHHQQKYSKAEIEKLFNKTKFLDVKIQRHALIPGQLGRIHKSLEWLTNNLTWVLIGVDRVILKTPLSLISQNFSIEAKKPV